MIYDFEKRIEPFNDDGVVWARRTAIVEDDIGNKVTVSHLLLESMSFQIEGEALETDHAETLFAAIRWVCDQEAEHPT